MTTRTLLAAAAAAAVGVLATGIAAAAEPPDKSGGKTPVVLTLLNSDSDLSGVPAVQRFVDRVGQLSGGDLTVEVRSQNDGRTGFEQRVVRAVKANEAQLAWVGTRVWDTLGVNTFRALHAPLLIDSYALQGAVLRSDIPGGMLAGLDGHGVVGLALLGDNLRYPAAAKRPLRGPADYKGLRFRSLTSATQAAAIRALGARPAGEGWAELGDALVSGRLGGLEVDLNTYESNAYSVVAPYVTLNVALWPRTTVLFANEAALAKLSEEQQRWVRQAAADAARYSLTTFGEDQRIVRLQCRNGMKAVSASPADMAALRRAFAPVSASLRRDPTTAAMLARIAALKRNVHAAALRVPSSCRVGPGRKTAGKARFPEGVFRARRTRADIRRVWPNAGDQDLRYNVATVTFTFREGAFRLRLTAGGVAGCRQGDGRFSANGQTMVVTLTDAHGCPLPWKLPHKVKLRWSYDGDTLRFRLAQPAYPLDHVVWEAVALTRIG